MGKFKYILAIILCLSGHCSKSESCSEGKFRCTNGRCVNGSLICDGVNDCLDSSDEKGCIDVSTVPCIEGQFPCENEGCIPDDKHCDGKNDCGDNSDEVGCPRNFGISLCHQNQFQCQNGICISEDKECNGKNDCKDSSDETDCPVTEYSCLDPHFRCDNGRCIEVYQWCDDHDDCQDFSDESHCNIKNRPWNYECPDLYFKCGFMCILDQWKCDGIRDCPSGSDESNCPTTAMPSTSELPVTPRSCTSNEFRCLNGKCIHSDWVCDQYYDCADQSDEMGCNTEGHVSQAVIISVSTALVVTLGLFILAGVICLKWRKITSPQRGRQHHNNRAMGQPTEVPPAPPLSFITPPSYQECTQEGDFFPYPPPSYESTISDQNHQISPENPEEDSNSDSLLQSPKDVTVEHPTAPPMEGFVNTGAALPID